MWIIHVTSSLSLHWIILRTIKTTATDIHHTHTVAGCSCPLCSYYALKLIDKMGIFILFSDKNQEFF